MSDILDDYREWKSQREERVGTHSDRCHMWRGHEACMIHRLAAELEATRLTDAERFVLREVCAAYADRDDVAANEIAAVIDNLLERTK